MHPFSSAKLPTLAKAEQLYTTALEMCKVCLQDSPDPSSPTTSSLRPHESSGAVLDSLCYETPPSRACGPEVDTNGPSSGESDLASHTSFEQIQTPTRIPTRPRPHGPPPRFPMLRSISGYRLPDPIEESEDGDESDSLSLPQCTPERSSAKCVVAQPSAGSETTTSARSTTDEHTQAEAKLDASIRALESQLHSHLAYLSTLKQETTTAHETRASNRARAQEKLHGQEGALPRSQSFWSFNAGDSGDKDTETKERIVEGRERDWRRERFDAVRYQRLAEVALDELGL